MAQAIVIKTDNTFEELELTQGVSLPEIQKAVGGWIDCVRGEDFLGYVNDEGLLIGLEHNLIASLLFGQHLVGNVVVVGAYNENGEYDGDDHDIPAHVRSTIGRTASTVRLFSAIFDNGITANN